MSECSDLSCCRTDGAVNARQYLSDLKEAFLEGSLNSQKRVEAFALLISKADEELDELVLIETLDFARDELGLPS